VTLGPVITSTSLTEDKVVGSEELTEGTGTDRVHGTRLEINQASTRDIATTSSFVKVHIDTLELEITITMVGTSGIDTVLIRDDLPELSTNLVTALTCLNVD